MSEELKFGCYGSFQKKDTQIKQNKNIAAFNMIKYCTIKWHSVINFKDTEKKVSWKSHFSI